MARSAPSPPTALLARPQRFPVKIAGCRRPWSAPYGYWIEATLGYLKGLGYDKEGLAGYKGCFEDLLKDDAIGEELPFTGPCGSCALILCA